MCRVAAAGALLGDANLADRARAVVDAGDALVQRRVALRPVAVAGAVRVTLQPGVQLLLAQYCPGGQLSASTRQATQVAVLASQRGAATLLQSASTRQPTQIPMLRLHTCAVGHIGWVPLQPGAQTRLRQTLPGAQSPSLTQPTQLFDCGSQRGVLGVAEHSLSVTHATPASVTKLQYG